MERLFAALTQALSGSPSVAVATALVWGVLSVVLSPCHLSSIPLIIAFIDGQGGVSKRRACLVASCFAFGILLTIAGVGVATAAAGRLLGDTGRYTNFVVAGVFFLVGLNLLDVIPTPWSGPGQTSMKWRGLGAAFLLGFVFGIAIGPCTFAYMAPMLGIAFKIGAEQPLFAASLLLAYGIGHCAVIVVAGTSTALVQKMLNWGSRSRGPALLRWGCGVLVLLGGLYLIYTAP
ncbi:MAG: cytochrome C biogenesis protein [Lentisphaerae bacterium]|jgi:cytochrome c-type biogenesis protein|nr:cytochrome C biogenesis protein [Lentisphaerota bacterium]MBT4817140.1 cytochrome C biogenesis protein [Lentisphaerota bacterium]MBT5611628.1 cytochrome C biogenesis protein [Lentisphaerota bacterium]MBT7056601.1 cytochrome C biogenesis protein [Lentisphaerota bacterium]MBT7845857.1 cytochrome C biogenesis protein [Lentisphaerota bacterium]